MRLGVVLLAVTLHGQTLTTVTGTGVPGFSEISIALASLQNKCDRSTFEQTSHITADAKGAIYLADANNQRIRRMEADGKLTTIAGDGAVPASNCASFNPVNDGASATAAHLYNPSDLAILPNGNLVIADQQNNRIRQITPAGAISTLAGNGVHNLYAPGNLATASSMDWPTAIAIDPNGQVVFSEIHSNRIGRINADGRLTTIANTAPLPTPAVLNKPMGIAYDRSGNLLIADTGNHRIRKLAPDGTLTTIAGTGAAGFCGDGGPAGSACFDTPMDVKVDSRGNIYIADTANNRIRRVDTAGTINTVASSPLNYPNAIAVDANDDLYVVDWQNYLLRKLSFASTSIGAVVDAASYGPTLAPGGIFTIFGASLGAAKSVQVNGKDAPVFFVSSGQINAQLPYEIAPGQATVTVLGATATTTVAATAPATFVAIHQDTVAIAYVTGLGAVDPPVATGATAPLDRLSYATASVTATIGGVSAPVQFAGLAPGFIGLGQVNVLIPSGVTDQTLVLEINGQKSKPVPIQ